MSSTNSSSSTSSITQASVGPLDGAVELDQFNPPSDAFRDTELKWNGWGYVHSYFALNLDGNFCMRSKKYKDLDGQPLPALRPWVEQNLGVDLTGAQQTESSNSTNAATQSSPILLPHHLKLPLPTVSSSAFCAFLRSHAISFSNAPLLRLVRSHGQSLSEIIDLRSGKIGRIPDLVVWPRTEEQIQKVLEGAEHFGVLLIPIGGGTSVSQALQCPMDERRCICSLDMGLMNRILHIDADNMTATVEAGILGQHLEKQLNERGLTCGHEPDSLEFSTLGGWISTRASGMKKNKYGNIEDLLLSARLCTPRGILQPRQLGQVPRLSSGPDLLQLLLGSEGQLGVLSQATIKVFRAPAIRSYGAILFPDFERGVQFFRAVALRKWQPASLRLVDNCQFQMGQAMRLQSSVWHSLGMRMARLYLTRWKGFRPDCMVAATCVFEGANEEVDAERERLFTLAAQFNGFRAPDENGKFGYRLTFSIAYLRDLALELGIIGESFETSVPWSRLLDLCRNVKQLLVRKAREHGVQGPVLATCRVTQVYDSGACIYFYFAFNYRGMRLDDAVHAYEAIEIAARNEIIATGGSISHHHGVGKIRKRWMPSTIGELGVSVIEALRENLDPERIFDSDNLLEPKNRSKL